MSCNRSHSLGYCKLKSVRGIFIKVMMSCPETMPSATSHKIPRNRGLKFTLVKAGAAHMVQRSCLIFPYGTMEAWLADLAYVPSVAAPEDVLPLAL